VEIVDPRTKAGYVLDREDTFAGPELDRTLWLPHHLPQWSSRAQSAARYRLDGHALRLVVEDDQPPWCPEFDGGTRVSSLQTGVLAGPLGSGVGQHRFAPDAVVREEQAERRLYTPRYGLFELRAAFPSEPSSMAALWMIGVEDRPEHSAEICVAEIFGRDVRPDGAMVGALVTVVGQSPAYPMQFMLGVYAFAGDGGSLPAASSPREFVVDRFTGYRRDDG
jgi:hypothetical protein